MLDLAAVDLGEIATALEDHSYEGGWWIDAETGEVWYWRGEEDDDPEFDPDRRDDARPIEPLPSSEAYGDMEDFIARVPDPRAADLLERAIAAGAPSGGSKTPCWSSPSCVRGGFGSGTLACSAAPPSSS